MKRGKRQIVQRANPFDDDQNNNVGSSLASHFESVPESQNSYQQHEPQSVNNNVQQSFQNSENSEKQKAVKQSVNDQRKKRLQQLRNKYLKQSTSQANTQKQPQIKKQPPPPPRRQQSPPEVQDSPSNRNQTQNQNNWSSQPQEQQEQQPQSQCPISKPTIPHFSQENNHQQEQTTIQSSVSPLSHNNVQQQNGNKKRTVPPPPPRPIARGQKKEQKQEEIQREDNNNKFRQKQEQQNTHYYSNYQQQPQQKQKQSTYEQQNNDFERYLHQWAYGIQNQNRNVHENAENIIKKISKQLSNGQNQLTKGLIQNFVVKNQSSFVKYQQKFVFQKFVQKESLSYQSKIYLCIKCGTDELSSLINYVDFSESLNQVVLLKQYFHNDQKQNFINFLITNSLISQQMIPKIIQFQVLSRNLIQFLHIYNFQNPTTIIQTLIQLKSKLNEQICPIYFKLLNSVLPQVTDEKTLEQILQTINSISFQSAYQLKKDMKLKIIQKIDRNSNNYENRQSSNFGSSYSYSASNNENNRQKQKQKQKGINLMGYFNTALNKIKSQIPQKQKPSPVSQQKQQKQSIVWDQVTKRYLINGKVPEDESGQRYDAQAEGKPKKKAPPPPPRAPKKNIPNTEPQNKYPHQQPQSQSQNYNDPYQQQQQQYTPQPRKIPTPPPPGSRLGLKAMPARKTRAPFPIPQ